MNPSPQSVSIAAGGRTIVASADFSYAENEITFLFGESGIGKSMLCKAVYGLLDPSELTIAVENRPYSHYLNSPKTQAIKRSGFFVFQEPSTHLHPLMRITEQLREGSIRGTGSEREILGRLWKTADDAKLKSVIDVYPKPYRPSGGEKQRVLLAMAFKKIALLTEKAAGPTFFVFDEPTGSLDNEYRNLFLTLLLEKYARRRFTVMFITHDYSIISEIYARHRSLLPHIHFKELSRTDVEGAVRQSDFSPEDYLGWLKGMKPPAPADRSAPTVLTVEPSFRVFGRQLTLYADPAHTRATPLAVRAGEMVYVKAPSGVGKTTLAKVVMGLYPAQEFAMTLAGYTVTHRTPTAFWQRRLWGRKAGMVFQHADEALNLEATVRETFDGLPLKRRLSVAQLKERLGELFEGDIPDSFLAKKVKYLSGGQKQRLNLLRTLVLATDLIILDEPLNALDFGSVKKVLDELEEKRAAGSALLMISHNEEIFDSMVDPAHVYYLAEGVPGPKDRRGVVR